ncbi:MAG: hypothetical protein SGPRY_001938 [Prymnesium sp.]
MHGLHAEGARPFKVESCDVPSTFDRLPGGVHLKSAMQEGSRLVIFASSLEAVRFSRLWVSSPAEGVVLAFVWLSLLTHFGNDEAAADRLFSQLAVNYARLISNTALSSEARDTLIWYLPEALVYTVSYTLRMAFPLSLQSFEADFRDSIFSEFLEYMGFTGERHLPTSEGDRCSTGTSCNVRGTKGCDGCAQTPVLYYTSASAMQYRHLRGQLAQLLGAPEGTPGSALGTPGPRTGVRMSDLPGKLPRNSCVLGALPPAKREWRDVSACSPLLKRYIQIRHAHMHSTRGGSTAREPHRVRCSSIAHRRSEEARLIESGAQTYRDLRRETGKKMERLMCNFNRSTADAMHEASNLRSIAQAQAASLVVERQRVLDRGHSRDWANYLASLRRLDDDRHCRDLANLAS